MTEIYTTDLLESETGMKKFKTNIDNVFIYHLQLGWNWKNSILSNQNDDRSGWYGEKSIHVEYSEFIDGNFCGKETVHYNGLEKEFQIK